MTERSEKLGIRVSDDLWRRYAAVVGNAGRSADLKSYMEWRVDTPHWTVGSPFTEPGAPVRKVRVDDALRKDFKAAVPAGDCSSDLRTYIAWRVANPATPLPGRLRASRRRDWRS